MCLVFGALGRNVEDPVKVFGIKKKKNRSNFSALREVGCPIFEFWVGVLVPWSMAGVGAVSAL